MTALTRFTLILILMLAVAPGAFAQETQSANPSTAAATETTAPATTPAPEKSAVTAEPAVASDENTTEGGVPTSYEIRSRFGSLIRNHPPEVASVLAIDPTLLTNEQYMAGYPAINEFVTAHPEIHRNPRFYLSEFQEQRGPQRSGVSEVLEGLTIFSTIGLVVLALAWMVRTIIEQKRWSRLSKTQTEVHNKILDRFGTSEEVLAYVKSPAGSKFLESAPIAVRAAQPVQPPVNAPMNRIMWSIQLGAGVAVGAAGMLLLSLRFAGETGEGVFAMGAIAFCVGAGFIASALVSLAFSRRLGLWNGKDAPEQLDDPGIVR